MGTAWLLRPRERVAVKHWTALGSTELVRDRWLTLTADRCRLADGSVIEPYYVMHEKDWVHVFAQTADSSVLVVRQFRYAARAVCAELPAGAVESGETALEAAKRELLEETGHVASEWMALGSLYANPARQTNSVHLFLARNATRVSEQRLDEGEALTYELATVDGIERMIDSREFSQALHVASFYRALAVLARQTPSIDDAVKPG